MKLRDIQALMSARLLGAEDVVFPAIFVANDISLPERLAVYENNVIGGLSGVLRSVFPCTEALVGSHFFKAMAAAFIHAYPPRTGCLNLYGAEFPEFIKTYRQASGLPYLPDVMRMEVAINRAYYAPDDEPLDKRELERARERFADMPLRLRASADLLESSYRLVEIRNFCLREDHAPHETLDVAGNAIGHFLVWRCGFESRVMGIGADDHALLSSLQRGNSLQDALAAVLHAYPQFDLSAFLHRHLAAQSLTLLQAGA